MATKTKKPTTADIRAWAQAEGYSVGARGRLSAEVVTAFRKSRRGRK